MNLEQLGAVVARGESEQLELKRSTGQRTDAAKTICAMFNGGGGYILFGVTDAGEIVGQEVSARTLEDVVHEIRRIEPPAFPDVSTTMLENDRVVIVVQIPVQVMGVRGPYTYDGRPYQRHGPTTTVMPRQRYERLLLERMHAAERWENQPAIGLTVADLDHAEIRRTVDEAIRRQRLEDPGTLDPGGILLGLGLIRDGAAGERGGCPVRAPRADAVKLYPVHAPHGAVRRHRQERHARQPPGGRERVRPDDPGAAFHARSSADCRPRRP